MNITDKIEYQRHLRTGNLVKKLYLLKCKGNKLTPEKFDSLCRLTWLHGDKKSALINIWDGREDKIPIKFLDLVENNNVGIVNYRNTYRNSTFDWIQTNFKQIRLLVDRVFKMNSDDVAMGIAIAIEQLPHISSPSKKNKLNPTSLLTPIFACMDQRNRFPLINGNENIEELLRKIGLTESSLPEKVEGLIRLIGSYGITDAFMLDVLSYNLSKKTFYSKKGKSRDKIKAKLKSLEQKNDSDLTILFALRSKKFIRLHNSMTNSLQKICKNCNCQINEGPDSNKFDALITNYDGNGIDLLIEAKSSILRPHLRLAVGQLWDYRRGLGRHIATHLAVLLPQKPDFESLEFLNYIGIKTLWFTNKTLKKIEGNFLTKISNKV